MKQRCKDGRFELAPEWADFPTYLRDMGPLPDPTWTTDRIDPHSRIYGPGKCRWADKPTQTQNRRNTRWVEVEGRRLTLRQFADELGLKYTTAHSALAAGKSPAVIAERAHRSVGSSAWTPPQAVRSDAFWAAFEAWRRRLLRDFRHLGRPEVYYLLRWYGRYAAAQDALDAAGLDQLPAEAEAEGNELLNSEAGLAWLEGRREIDLTLAYIRERDPELAVRLTPRNGQHFRALAQLHRRATEMPTQHL